MLGGKGWKVSGWQRLSKYSMSCLYRQSHLMLICLVSCSIFILCLWRESHKYNDVSVPTYLISCSAGKPWCLWLQYQAVNHLICVKNLGFKWLVFMFGRFFFPLKVIPWSRVISSILSHFYSFHFALPHHGVLFQPPLFPHQIPSLHNYHLLILNESPNTLHGFNTAC